MSTVDLVNRRYHYREGSERSNNWPNFQATTLSKISYLYGNLLFFTHFRHFGIERTYSVPFFFFVCQGINRIIYRPEKNSYPDVGITIPDPGSWCTRHIAHLAKYAHSKLNRVVPTLVLLVDHTNPIYLAD